MDRRDAYIEQLEDKIDQLKRENEQAKTMMLDYSQKHIEAHRELEKTRIDAGMVVHALNCAVQLIEALIAFTPHGSVVHPNVATCKTALDNAMHAITGRSPP